MIDIESIIRNEINVPVSDDLSLYKSIETKKLYTPKIRKIVNDNVPKLDYAVNNKILKEINETGYSVVDNFLSENEVDYIANFISQFKGYNFHTPNRAYNTKPEFYNNDLDWNVCSYKMNHMLQNPFILNLILRKDIISIVQEYLGCLPTFSGVNIWWSKFTGEKFHTQNLHRDYDDFKFLTFFIYLSDVNDENGPHVYYENTHNGSENMDKKVVVKGKKGTAIFGDTYALHYGQPLQSNDRLLYWTRYTLHKSNNFYRDKNHEFIQEESVFFDSIDDNYINRHLLHAFMK